MIGQFRDQLSGDDPIAMAEVDLNGISVMGEQGFLPTFGPCWLNFFGAPREEGKEATGGENEHLNLGKVVKLLRHRVIEIF